VNTDTPNRFEDRLLAALLDDFENLTAAPAARAPGPARRRPACWSRPAWRTVPLLAGGLAVAAAVALSAAGLTALGSHARAPGAGIRDRAGTLVHPRIRTAAYVVDHMRAAVNTNTAVLRILDHAPDSQTGKPVVDEIWSTARGRTSRVENLDRRGRPIDAYIVTETAHRTVSTHISYRDRTWSRTTYRFGTASSPGSPGPRRETARQGTAQLRAEVAAGKVTLVGPAVVDGQQAIKLKEVSARGVLYLWVNRATYLPIRTIGTAPGGSPASDQAIRDDYRWLPATPASLRLVSATPAIPAGFTRVGG
jgi:hypothetical protein